MKTKSFSRLLVLAGCVLSAMGCATSGGGSAATAAPKGADDKAVIAKTLGEWGSALAAKDVDKIVSFYSDSFKSDDGTGKDGLKEFLGGVISAGYLDGAKVDVAGAQISVNGEEAVVAPLNLSGNMGAATLSLSLKKEAGTWRIVSSSMQS